MEKKQHDWDMQYRCHIANQVFGEIRYTHDFEDGRGKSHTFKCELMTDIPDGVIVSNGDNQKKWIKTLRECMKREGYSSRGSKNLKWISWDEDDTQNKQKFIVEYTRINISEVEDQWNNPRVRIVETDVSVQRLYDILKWSRVVKNGGSYTNGTTYKGFQGSIHTRDMELKHIFINEDVRFTNQNENTLQELKDNKPRN